MVATEPLNCERDAIAQAQRGSATAFAFLYGRHRQRVYALCLRMAGNHAEAEELAQEAFLQLFRKIATFRGDSAFSTWLHRLAVNVALMRLRRKRLPQAPLHDGSAPSPAEGPAPVLGVRDPALTGALDRIALQRALGLLAPKYHATVMLHDVAGLNHREIAARLGCSCGTSRLHLHRAHLELRRMLQPPAASPAASPAFPARSRQVRSETL
ncbi:MAG TPA: RNA polymerase sigma factor [Terriglobales bacterium]|nr:RNA polymerase sigma factor [Terriglobales bacterium]